MLSVQKPSLDKTGLGYVKSGLSSMVTPTKFVPPMSMHKPKVRVYKDKVLAIRKIMVDLSDTKPKKRTHLVGKKQHKPQWFCHFCGRAKHTHPNCFKLQASKQATKPKVSMSKAQDPMKLIHELIKALNLYVNTGVDQQSYVSNNFNFRSTSKKVWMQKTQHK